MRVLNTELKQYIRPELEPFAAKTGEFGCGNGSLAIEMGPLGGNVMSQWMVEVKMAAREK